MKLQISSFLNAIKNRFKHGDFLIRIILIYCGVYFVQISLNVFDLILFKDSRILQNVLEQTFYLSSKTEIVPWKFYTLLSYQFFHDGILHLLINILLLYFFGKVLLNNYPIKKLVPLYFLGGIFAALLYRIVCQFSFAYIPPSPIVGASASIMALLAASSILYPDYKIKLFLILDIPLKWLTLSLIVLQLIYLGKSETIGTGIIHLGGLLFGFAYVVFDKKGFAIYRPFNQVLDYLLAFLKFRMNSIDTRKHAWKKEKPKQESDKISEIDQDKIDAILDKISTYGYESLSKLEKDYLFRASKN
ncbi:MAG: rhomboid family intramembrane serine protease [Chitinophagales bacterium]|nr:rhomboid family intramembrane serine protease [Chitinophagales bacterium]